MATGWARPLAAGLAALQTNSMALSRVCLDAIIFIKAPAFCKKMMVMVMMMMIYISEAANSRISLRTHASWNPPLTLIIKYGAPNTIWRNTISK